MLQELVDIFRRNFPFTVRSDASVQWILGHEGNTVFEERDAKGRLIGAAVINGGTILMLCVDPEFRRQGLGGRLLKKAEDAIWENGHEKIKVGCGFDYLAPGVPTAKRYFPAENEKLYPGLDGTASDFFTHRGYVHSWECNCFDMRFPLCEFREDAVKAGQKIDGITYRFASPDDKENVCACMDDAYPEFTQYYRDDALYQEGAGVLVADTGNELAGALIVGAEDAEKGIGSVGCVAVREGWRGRHIAVNLVMAGTGHLKESGFKEAYLSYTYSGLDHMYGYAGYKICVYFMMATKGGQEA